MVASASKTNNKEVDHVYFFVSGSSHKTDMHTEKCNTFYVDSSLQKADKLTSTDSVSVHSAFGCDVLLL